MKIGICDDEPAVARVLLQFVKRSMDKIGIKAEIITFLSGVSLIERVEELEAVFLDIEMPLMDGFEVGRAIMKINPSCKIIMATGRVDRFKDSFKINAFRFVTKPYSSTEIEEALEALIKMKIGEEAIQLYFNRIPYEIPQKNIKYFKAFNGYTEAIMDDKCFRRDLSLNEIEELLDNRLFVRIHKQYIINMNFIDSYKNSMINIDGMRLPISRRKRKDFERMFINFDVNYGG